MTYSPEELLMIIYIALILFICIVSGLVALIVETVRFKKQVKRFKAIVCEHKAQERYKRKWDRQTIPMLNRFSEGK